MTLFIIFCVFLQSEFSVLDDTGIYTPPSSESVAFVDGDHGFLIDREGSRLLSFDFSSNTTQALAEQGKGPGDVDRPSWVRVVGGRLIVLDRNGFQVFNTAGAFLERIRVPSDLVLRPARENWFGLFGTRYSAIGEPLKAVSVSRDLQTRQTLTIWSSEVERGESRKPTGFPMPWNPVESFTRFTIDKTGRYGYVLPKGIDAIHVFDLEKKAEIQRIRFPERKIPFDETWGRKQIEKLESMVVNRDSRFSIEPVFPDYFPAIRRFAVTAENRFVVSLWHPDSDEAGAHDLHNTKVFDPKGNPTEPTERDFLWERLLYVAADTIVFQGFDPDTDEYTLIRCHPDELKSALARFPAREPD